MKRFEEKENFEPISIRCPNRNHSMNPIIGSPQSLNSSITSECKLNGLINDSLIFQNSFFTEKPLHTNNCKDLKEKIVQLSQQLQDSYQQNLILKKKLEVLHKETTFKLQFMQEQHEKKLQKNKQNLDFLLKDLNSRSNAILADQLCQKHLESMENLREYYEGVLADLRGKHEQDLYLNDMKRQKFCESLREKLRNCWKEGEKQKFGAKSEYLQEIMEEIRVNEVIGKELLRESYEEMSTLESEHEKTPVSCFSLQKSKKSQIASIKNPQRNSLTIVHSQHRHKRLTH